MKNEADRDFLIHPSSLIPHPSSLSASYGYCCRLVRSQATNFYPAFLLLPRAQRLAMYSLYAFLRVSDDLATSRAMCS